MSVSGGGSGKEPFYEQVLVFEPSGPTLFSKRTDFAQSFVIIIKNNIISVSGSSDEEFNAASLEEPMRVDPESRPSSEQISHDTGSLIGKIF